MHFLAQNRPLQGRKGSQGASPTEDNDWNGLQRGIFTSFLPQKCITSSRVLGLRILMAEYAEALMNRVILIFLKRMED